MNLFVNRICVSKELISMTDCNKFTVRFRHSNVDEMRAYNYLCSYSKEKNMSMNMVIVSALLKASAEKEKSYETLVRDVVEGISSQLRETGMIISNCNRDSEERDSCGIEFSEEDFIYMG